MAIDPTSAKIVAKFAGKLLSTVLTAKAAQIKEWIENKEINSIVTNNERSESALKGYTKRLLNRCTTVSTLVFPQERIPLESIYEPLTLKNERHMHTNQGKKIDIDYINDEQTYVIVDDAGMGKSTFSKNLAIKIILNSNKLPLFFEFSEYDQELSLIDNLSKELNEINKDFDKKLFSQLITHGKFFIILDGFDEIPRALQKKISKEICELNSKKGKSSLLLTSRPHEKLPALEKSQNLSLTKLNTIQAKSILKKLDKIKNREVGKNLILELKKIPQRFLETPLLVCLLYRTYSFNRSIAKKTSVFYPEIYEALYKGHDLTKSGFERDKASNLEIDTFRKLLASFCFHYIADPTGKSHSQEFFLEIIKKAKKVTGLTSVKETDFFEDLLLSVPLMTKDGNTYKFMHRTIAEFFCAEFISRHEKSTKLLEKIIASNQLNSFWRSIDFIYEISEQLYNKVITHRIATDFIAQNTGSRKDKFYKTESFVFKTEFYIYSETEKKAPSIPNGKMERIYLPLREEDGQIIYTLELTFSLNSFTPRNALEQLCEIETLDTPVTEFKFQDFGDMILKNLKVNQKYTTKSQEFINLFKNPNFRRYYVMLFLIRGIRLDINTRKAPYISIQKCKKLVKQVEDTERSNENLTDFLGAL